MKSNVPVTVITGYLGSGKTTLLKKMLNENILSRANVKIAVLVNEFGEIGVDSETVKGDNVDVKELLGGCVCCSLTGEFKAALEEIVTKFGPERVVIETTGVAEPDAMLTNLEGINGVYLDSVITVVDANALLRFPSVGHTGRMQIESANIVILNKIDIVPTSEIPKMETFIRELVPGVEIIRSAYANVDTKKLFNVGATRKKVKKEVHQLSGMESFSYKSKRVLNRQGFMTFVRQMPDSIYRAKGRVIFADGTYLFNYVKGNHDFAKSEGDENELVFIGDKVGGIRDAILKYLKDCEM